MAEVLLKRPDGKFVTVDSSEADSALAEGYVPATQAQVDASKQTGQAALEGVARGATLGFIEPQLRALEAGWQGKSLQQTSDEMKARREENPLASGAGELGGAVGMSLLTGGGASALVGGGVRGAAFEGGLYGLGTMVSEDVLENRASATDRLAAGMIGGALAGGGAHAGLQALGKGVSLGVSKFGGKGVKDTLGSLADEVERRALTQGNKRWADRYDALMPDILRVGREEGILGKASSALDKETAAKARAVAEKFRDKIGQEMKELEGYVPLKGDKELREELADYVNRRLESAFSNSPTYDSALRIGKKTVKSLSSKDRTWSEVWDVQSSMFKDVDVTSLSPAATQVREETRQAIRDFVFNEVASGKNKAGRILTGFEPSGRVAESLAAPEIAPRTIRLGEDPIAGALRLDVEAPVTVEGAGLPLRGTTYTPPAEVPLGRALPGPLGGAHVVVEGAVPSPGGVFTFPGSATLETASPRAVSPRLDLTPRPGEIAPRTVTLGGEAVTQGGLSIAMPEKATPAWFGAKLRQTGRDSAAAQALADAIETRAQAIESSGGILGLGSMKSLGAAAVVGFSTGNPLAAAAGALAETQIRKRGGLAGGAALRALSESRVTNGISKSLSGHLGRILQTAPEVLGAYRFPLEKAAAMGADALLQEHLRLASSDEGQHYLATVALPVEDREGVNAAGQRIAVLDAIDRASLEGEAEMDRAIDGIFGSAPGRRGTPTSTISAKEFKKTMESMGALLRDPNKAFEQVPADIRAAAPATAMEAAAKLVQAAQYLDSKAPKSPYAGMPESIAPQWQPSPADLDRFNRYKEAVETPAKVLKNMSQGYISPEQVEALKAVYPAMYAELQQKMSERLMMWKKPLTYQQRLSFSAILGPAALGMKPEQVQILQQMQAATSSAGQPSGGMKGPDGRQDVNEAQIQTEAQKLESRK